MELRKIYDKFLMSNYQNENVVPDVDKWNEFINSLPNPSNNIEIARNKYLCKKTYFSLPLKIGLEVFSALALIPALITLILPCLRMPESLNSDRLLLEKLNHLDYKDIVPERLFNDYKDVVVVEFSQKKFGLLIRDAKKLFFKCYKKYWFDPLFLFFIYKELAKQSDILRRYNPKATALYASERNIALPVITELYENQNRKFISFMHGDYLLQLNQGFMQFTEYYTWDEEYNKMFTDVLRCNPKQFITYTPIKLMKKWNLENIIPEYYCTFYISEENEETLKTLSDIFKKFEEKGKKCKVRLHPRWNAKDMFIREVFKDFYIEEPKSVSLETSLGSTEYALGLASTVLHEAYIEGRKVVIDDITSPRKYENLKNRCYIMLRLDHSLLSELIAKE